LVFKYIIITLLSLFISGCGGDSEGNFKTIYTDLAVTPRVVSGIVAKGPIKNASVVITSQDGRLLGRGITDKNGYYSINIGEYDGIVLIESKGGSYVDEIDDTVKNAKDVVLKAVSVVSDDKGYKVNVTPYSTIAVKNISDFRNRTEIEKENKNIAKVFIGKEFDITKVDPKIFNKDKITDSDESKFGLMLAVFSKVTNSSPSLINNKIEEFSNDYKDDGCLGDAALEIEQALSDDSFSKIAVVEELQNNIKIQKIFQKISNFIEDDSNPAPTVEDYNVLGMSTITADVVDSINLQLKQKDFEEIDTQEKLKNFINNADITPPTFISPSAVNVLENQTSALRLEASDEHQVSYSIYGGDSDSFYLNEETGEITFKVKPDFESKNIYMFTAIATDGINQSFQDIKIYIMDVESNLSISYAGYADLNSSGTLGDKIFVYFNQDVNESTLDFVHPENIFDINASKRISGRGEYNSSTKIYTIFLDENAIGDINSSVEKIGLKIKQNTIKDMVNNEPPSYYNSKIFTSGTIEFKNKVYGLVTSVDTGRVWLDRNLDANKVCENPADKECFGALYQWGRLSDGHQKYSNPSTLSTDILPTTITPNHDKFIKVSGDWVASGIDDDGSQRSDRWASSDGSGICPIGFHVPTYDELKADTIDATGDNQMGASSTAGIENFLKLPQGGWRRTDATIGEFATSSDGGGHGFLWTSTPDTDKYEFHYFFNRSCFTDNHLKSSGIAVRCIKD